MSSSRRITIRDIAEERGYRINLIRLPRTVEAISEAIPSVFSERKSPASACGASR
ncbi:MAG: hypothetical protein K9N23_13950 [Akkermansiaceae bacterium]|nr:hypothetical protein [Akkermansiaceae bacterium]MCF7732788.1 hypothetical protein [Akkermansiaceae bacterium]